MKRSLELKCIYKGDNNNGDDGEFLEWYKDDIPISKEIPGHYVVQHQKNQSILTIKIFGKRREVSFEEKIF